MKKIFGLTVLMLLSVPVIAVEQSEEHVHSHDCAHERMQRMLNQFNTIGKQQVECSPPLKIEKLDEESQKLADKKWYAGAPDCRKPEAKTPPYEVLQVNDGFYVLRQNKCINFEAPFVYLYIGDDSALLVDTGATHDDGIRKWVDEVLKKHPKGDKLKLVVSHSHSHGDHMAGDITFADRPNTTIVGRRPSDVAEAFGVKNWPNGEGSIDLGNRKLSVIPIPGHEASSVAFYDHKSGDLLTGDTMYPGNIFLSEPSFPVFKESINRLHAFSQKHKVRNILGAHVEMSAEPGVDFPYGTTYQPNEHKLPLRQENLDEIKNYLDGNPEPKYKKFADIIIDL